MYDVHSIIARVYECSMPSEEDLAFLLSLEDEDELDELYAFADEMRAKHMGDGVLLRGLIEFANCCRNNCFYCGLRHDNSAAARYRLTRDEVLAGVRDIAEYGLKTVVLQAGEDEYLDVDWLAGIIAEIKERFSIAITLSVGERTREEYSLWRSAGADRYLLKIETSDKALYGSMQNGRTIESRLACLGHLRDLGYQVGSGIMVGLKGQTIDSIARDILFFKEMNFDMIGIGPFIPHPSTPFSGERPSDVDLVLKTIALTRIVTKNAHLPATTALGSMGADYRIDGLKCGANVLMPNFTPAPYRSQYEIYPGKRCVSERAGACIGCMEKNVSAIGRSIDLSVGHSLKRVGK